MRGCWLGLLSMIFLKTGLQALRTILWALNWVLYPFWIFLFSTREWTTLLRATEGRSHQKFRNTGRVYKHNIFKTSLNFLSNVIMQSPVYRSTLDLRISVQSKPVLRLSSYPTLYLAWQIYLSSNSTLGLFPFSDSMVLAVFSRGASPFSNTGFILCWEQPF